MKDKTKEDVLSTIERLLGEKLISLPQSEKFIQQYQREQTEPIRSLSNSMRLTLEQLPEKMSRLYYKLLDLGYNNVRMDVNNSTDRYRGTKQYRETVYEFGNDNADRYIKVFSGRGYEYTLVANDGDSSILFTKQELKILDDLGFELSDVYPTVFNQNIDDWF